jgi:hypothetical protein
MATAKSVFERSSANSSPPMAKKTSKWDKPKGTPPPPINRDFETASDANVDPELPPPSYTKSMLAKFQSLQQTDESGKDNNASDENQKKVSA